MKLRVCEKKTKASLKEFELSLNNLKLEFFSFVDNSVTATTQTLLVWVYFRIAIRKKKRIRIVQILTKEEHEVRKYIFNNVFIIYELVKNQV